MFFTEKDRLIFQYHNGKETVWGDPAAIGRRMKRALGGDVNRVVRDVNAVDEARKRLPKDADPHQREQAMATAEKVADAAMESFLTAVREAFDLVPFNPADGSGATEAHVLAAYDAWREFEDQKKTKGESTPALSPTAAPGYLQGQLPTPSSTPSA